MKIAIILSGCGVFDGSEISETVCTMLNIDNCGAEYACFAPDIEQIATVNHLNQQKSTTEQRNVLVESARIARGKIQPLNQFRAIDFDAVIFPGGSGVISNLCNFSTQGSNCTVNQDITRVIVDCFESRMPIGAICIAPVLLAATLGTEGITVTIGNDSRIATAINQTGARHAICSADDIITDEKNLIVTTPAYMLAQSIKEVNSGIGKLVRKIIDLAEQPTTDE